jgi:single-strand DNA-binding protein
MVNHVVLVGNLGSDPEVRAIGDRQKVTRLSVATHEIVTKRTGERERQTEWHQVVAWGALGERAAEHLRKGRSVLVQGRLQTRFWADARGNKHITAEVNADRILSLGGGNTDRDGANERQGRADGKRPQHGSDSRLRSGAPADAEPAS